MKQLLLVLPIFVFLFGCDDNKNKEYTSPVVAMRVEPDQYGFGAKSEPFRICKNTGGPASLGLNTNDKSDCLDDNYYQIVCFVDTSSMYGKKMMCRLIPTN